MPEMKWLIAGAVFIWFATRPKIVDIVSDSVGDNLNNVLTPINDAFQEIGYSMFRINNMRAVKPEMLNNRNVRALLNVIRYGEGTYDANGYRRMFGGALFDSYADHPRQRKTFTVGGRRLTSTAAGAYQFLASTWDETAQVMGLKNFSPANQDLGALGRIAARGALDDALSGRFNTALAKINKEWASMPGSPYGQPVLTWARAREIYAANAGVASDTLLT